MDRMTVKRPDHNDEPSCPRCGHYNAMLHLSGGWLDEPEILKCRDCGQEATLIK